MKAFIDFHSFSQMWMSPWAFTTEFPPDYNRQVGGLNISYLTLSIFLPSIRVRRILVGLGLGLRLAVSGQGIGIIVEMSRVVSIYYFLISP